MPYIGNPIYQSAFVTDQFSGTGSQTAYTMSVAPAGVSNVLVAVSGVLQDPSTYGVVGNTLTFSTAPPSGTGNISCRYLGVPASGVVTTAYRTVTEFTATASQTTFTPPSYTVGFINVYRNGVLLGSADYTATNGTTVVLTTGATAGDLVTVESFSISSVANAIPNAAGSVGTNNIADGAVTPAKLSTGGPSWASNGNLTTTGSITVGSISQSGGLANSRLKVKQTTNTNLYYGMQLEASGSDTSLFIANNDSAFNIVSTYGSTGSYQPITLWTGGSERMRIDSSGRVTMPYQPAFYAMNTTTYTSSQIMVCGSVFVNIGSSYNSSNGRFTAPVAGTYSFSFNALKRGGAGRMLCYKNGAYYGAGVSQTYSGVTTEIPHAATVVITLAVNDYVQVYLSIDAGDFYGSANSHSGFSGQLIG